MDINRQATLVARKELFIQAPPAVVWKTLVDIDSFSKWHPGVSEAKPDGPVAPGSHFYLKGGGITWNSTLQVVEPERCIGWTGTAVGAQTVP
jgi:uncharacterized protein YndB with AHSA1/START domain